MLVKVKEYQLVSTVYKEVYLKAVYLNTDNIITIESMIKEKGCSGKTLYRVFLKENKILIIDDQDFKAIYNSVNLKKVASF